MDNILSKLVYIFVCVLLAWLLFVTIRLCQGATVTVTWDVNPPSDQVTNYEVKVIEVFGMASSSYVVEPNRATITNLVVGKQYLFSVRAKNALLWSDFSEDLVVIPQVKHTIQFSVDLFNWSDIKTVTGPRGFVRIKSEY